MKTNLIWDFGSQFAREPILRPMPDGSLVCLFLTGGPTEPHNDNVLMLSRSTDGGDHWSAPREILRHSHRGVWCTELFTHGPAPMLVVMTYQAQCHYRELENFRSYTCDSGETWTEPVSFPSGLNGVSLRQGFVMSNGEWFFPLYWQEVLRDFDWQKRSGIVPPDDRGERWPFACGCAISPDQGETFQRYGYLHDRATCKSLWEPNAVELEPGHIVMLMRDGARTSLRRADSMDYGRTWGEPVDSGIPNAKTKLTLLRRGEHVLLINNFTGESGMRNRKRLEVWVSDDGMATWRTRLPLCSPEESFFYPHGFLDEQTGTLYVAYENAHQHYLTRVSFEELHL